MGVQREKHMTEKQSMLVMLYIVTHLVNHFTTVLLSI